MIPDVFEFQRRVTCMLTYSALGNILAQQHRGIRVPEKDKPGNVFTDVLYYFIQFDRGVTCDM
jgi:hypothetical protein